MKVRTGNDIQVAWTLPEGTLQGGPFRIAARLQGICIYVPLQYEQEGDVVSFTFYGKDQPCAGIYDLVVQENRGGIPMVTYDVQGAVELVEHSWEEDDGATPEGVEVSVTRLTSTFTPVNRRIGNDIPMTWTLAGAELPEDYAVVLKVEGMGIEVEMDCEASGGAISFTFYGKDQPCAGIYDMVLRADGMTFDAEGAVELVPHSWEQDEPSLLSTVIRDN